MTEEQIAVWGLYYQAVLAVAGVVIGPVLAIRWIRQKRLASGQPLAAWVFWLGLAGMVGVGLLALWFWYTMMFEGIRAAVDGSAPGVR